MFDVEAREQRTSSRSTRVSTGTATFPGVGTRSANVRSVRPYDPAAGTSIQSEQDPDRPYAPKAIEGPIDWDRANVRPYGRGRRREGTSSPDHEDDAAAIQSCVVIDRAFDWRRTGHLQSLVGVGGGQSSTRHTFFKGTLTKLHPDCRGPAAARTQVSHPRPRAVRQPERRTRGKCWPIKPHRRRGASMTSVADDYWGYSSIGYLTPHALLRSDGHAGAAGAEQGMVKALHRAGTFEVMISTSSKTTPPRHHLGRMLRQGRRQRQYLPLEQDEPRFSMGLHRAATREPGAPACGGRYGLDSATRAECQSKGSRLDLRVGARARVIRGRRLSAFSNDYKDPVALQVKLSEEAVGRRPGVTRSAIPRALGGVNGIIKRHDARTSGAARRTSPTRVSLTGSSEPLPGRTAGRRHHATR